MIMYTLPAYFDFVPIDVHRRKQKSVNESDGKPIESIIKAIINFRQML